MSKNPEQPASSSRRRFFRQFLASAIEGVEEVGKNLNEAKREMEAQRRAWSQPPRYNPPPWKPPETYGPPWPPPYGPPVPVNVRRALREKQRHYYGGAIARDDMMD